ncbi:hypothetical protein A2U01_0113392, partial [Trifolium medium]|nr:hypothetical protein [Trifolium medium]
MDAASASAAAAGGVSPVFTF